jgi:hypothetical protein
MKYSAGLTALLVFGMAMSQCALAQDQHGNGLPMLVGPFTIDPNQTQLVTSQWVTGIGCPTGATVVPLGGAATLMTDSACPTGDPSDTANQGLLLVKGGPTGNSATAAADIHNITGTVVTEVGFDIRSGSHCAAAPRFSVVTADNVTHSISCASLLMVLSASPGWRRLRLFDLTQASPPIAPGSVVQAASIVFDDGQDTGPDFSGQAILDNIDVNGTLLGQGSATSTSSSSPHQGTGGQ